MNRNYLVTGGAGFIGSHLAKLLLMQPNEQVHQVVIVDSLEYSANPDNFIDILDDNRFFFYQTDVNNQKNIRAILDKHKIDCIFHLAGHTHVDRSLDSHDDFMTNNVIGTYNLYSTIQHYYQQMDKLLKPHFKVIHVSTDEVYGDSKNIHAPLNEKATYNPTSLYAGTKAAADMLITSFANSYNIPILKLHLCNNFGPNQFPEKLIPVTILSAIQGKEVRVYGNGQQRRQWIYVKDCVQLMYLLSQKWDKKHSKAYNICGQETSNLELVELILTKLDQLYPIQQNQLIKNKHLTSYSQLIEFVADRPNHDQRYWTKDSLLQTTGIPLPRHDLDLNLTTTIKWYLLNQKNYLHKVVQFKHDSETGDRLIINHHNNKKQAN